MRLISSKDAIDFFSQEAPRPWVGRMLCWMVWDGQLDAYFEKAKIQPSVPALQFLLRHREEAGEYSGKNMDEILRREYEPELAARIVGKTEYETVLDEPVYWDGKDGPTIIDTGYILFASSIDWEAGSLRCDWIPDGRDLRDMWFPNEELLYSQFDSADYAAEFSGLAFEYSRIEMLLPNAGLSETSIESREAAGRTPKIGRPRKWDWEGALAFVTTQAQTPDGLPTGHGAQAKLEAMIAEWFERETGGSPSISQIRQRASKAMRMIEKG